MERPMRIEEIAAAAIGREVRVGEWSLHAIGIAFQSAQAIGFGLGLWRLDGLCR
jgi:hypothetical protein